MPRSFPTFESLKQNAKMRGWRQPFTNETEQVYRHRQAEWLRDVDRVEAAEVLSGVGWDQMSPMALLTGAGIDLSPMQSFLNLPIPEDPFQFVGEGNERPLTDWLMDPCLSNNSHYFTSRVTGRPVYQVYFRKPLMENSGIVVASISCSDRQANITELENPVSRDAVRQLIVYLNAMAFYTMTSYISFEQVLTGWLRNKLVQYGFEEYQELSFRIRARHPALLNLDNPTVPWLIEKAIENNVSITCKLLDLREDSIVVELQSGGEELGAGVCFWKKLSPKVSEWLNKNAR